MKKVEWVSLVDDDPVVREALKQRLRKHPHLGLRSEHGSAEEALTELPVIQPDILTLDVRMGAMDGMECLHLIRNLLHVTRIVLFTAFGSRDILHHALKGDANGLVQKGKSLEPILSAMQWSTLDGFYLPHEGMISLADTLPDGRTIPLTPRERTLLVRVVAQQGNKQIAADLNLNADYVARRLSELYVKLGVRNRAGAAVLARELGLTPQCESRVEGA